MNRDEVLRGMTVAHVERRLRRIERLAGGAFPHSEQCHVEQDSLWATVLQAIALGASEPERLAAAALKAWDIKFDRWYA